ncbi:hypothetical protein SRABI128_05258 [Microbacterium sp. Bi128]|nr:hypothetical protein SRABI128_05258 [Microbacterium sp. Bi128]
MAAGGLVRLLPHCGQQRTQGLHVLQQPKPGGVGRADVHHEIIRCGGQAARADQVIGHRILEPDHLALADVHPDHGPDAGVLALQGGAGGLQARGHRRGAVVVESHAVNDGPVLHEAEQPRRRVPGLGLAGDGADLHMAEAELRQRLDAVAFLVEAGRKAERGREGQAKRLGLQRRRGGGELLQQPPGTAAVGEADGLEPDLMGAFGVHP